MIVVISEHVSNIFCYSYEIAIIYFLAGKIRFNVVHKSPRFWIDVCTMATLKDELFVTYKSCKYMYPKVAINVYDCNNLAVVKDVIPLPTIFEHCMEACNVSNCVYILHRTAVNYIRVLRIARDDDHQFNVTPFISKVWMPNPNPTLSVTAEGRLIFSRQQKDKRPVICFYNANGSFHREMTMRSDIPSFSRIIPKANGNLVLVSTNDQTQTMLTEIDMDTTIIRQYLSSLEPVIVCNTGIYGGMLIVDQLGRIELLDSEFNVLDATGPQLYLRKLITYNQSTSHFNCDRNELAAVVLNDDDDNNDDNDDDEDDDDEDDDVFNIPTKYNDHLGGRVAIFRFSEE